MKLNLKHLDGERAIVQGRAFAIEDRETGRVFLTNKNYIDKLFDEMGYRNLNVIKVLEDFAGQVITDVGKLATSQLYIDEITDSFVVVSPESLKKLEDLFGEFKDKGFEVISENIYDTYHYWDQYVIKSSTGTQFAVYVDLCDEYVHVLSLSFDKQGCLNGLINEGKYKLEDDDFIQSLTTLMSNPIDASVGVDPDQFLSMREYVELLELLGYVNKKKKKYFLTEDGENAQNSGYISDLEAAVEEYNVESWLQRCINSSRVEYKKAFKLVSDRLDRVTYWQIRNLYTDNACEKSDMFALNA